MLSREYSNEKEVSSWSSSSTTSKCGATNEERAEKIANLLVNKMYQQGKKGHEVGKTNMFSNCNHLEAQLSEILNAHHPVEDCEYPATMVGVKNPLAWRCNSNFFKECPIMYYHEINNKMCCSCCKAASESADYKKCSQVDSTAFSKECVAGNYARLHTFGHVKRT